MNQTIDQYEKNFFIHFNSSNWTGCEDVLASIQSQIDHLPHFAPWEAYFSAILIDRRANDFGLARQLLLQLLNQELQRPLRVRVLRAIGIIGLKTNDWQNAITHLQQAIDITLPNESTRMARTLHEKAIAFSSGYDTGEFGEPALQRAAIEAKLALQALVKEPSSLEVLNLQNQILNTLAIIHKSLKQFEQAIAYINRKVEICEQLNNPFSKGIALGNLGEIYHEQGGDYWQQAKVAYKAGLVLVRAHEQHQEKAIDILANLGLLYQDMEKHSKSLDYYTQAIALIEQLRIGITGTKARIGYFATVASIYDQAILLCVSMKQWDDAFYFAERARARAFLEMLSTQNLSSVTHSPTLSLAEIQHFLPDDAIIVAYYTTGLLTIEAMQSERQATAKRHRFPTARTLIFAITREQITVVDSPISPNSFQSQKISAAQMLEGNTSHRLYTFLVAPIVNFLQEKRLIYFIPHGPIHSIPLHALEADDGDSLLRENGPLILYAPSASLLYQESMPSEISPSKSCLAIGYAGDGKRPLSQAEPSARHIANVLHGTAVTGSESKLNILEKDADQFRIIHIATHGKFNPAAPLQSALNIGTNEWLTAADVISLLNLNAELVVLSACETGLSQVHRGDELDGFVRAFMQAGTSAVITTNWHVHDNTTAILMDHFYAQFEAGAPAATALKRAQLFLKNLTVCDARPVFVKLGIPFNVANDLPDDEMLFLDPIFWAPFTLMVRSQRSNDPSR